MSRCPESTHDTMYSTLPIPMMQGGSVDLMHGSDDGTGSGLTALSGSPTDYMNDPNGMLGASRNNNNRLNSTVPTTTTSSSPSSSLFMPQSSGKLMFPMGNATQHRPRGRKPSHGSSQHQQMSPGLLSSLDHQQQQQQQQQQQHLHQVYHPGNYVTIKSEGSGGVSPPPHSNSGNSNNNALIMNEMFGTGAMSQLVMPSVMQQGDMMVVGQNMEVGNDGGPGDVILVSDMIKAGVIEGGEVVVGGGGGLGVGGMHHHHHHHLPGNEIVIGGHHNHHHRGRLGIGHQGGGGSSSAGSAEDSEYDDAALVIDTTGVRDDVDPSMSHQQQHHHHHHQNQHHQQQQQQQSQQQHQGLGYDCAECGATLKSRGSLKKHIQKYHPQNPEPEDAHDRLYACPTCPYQTQRRDKLDKHMAKHLAEGFGVSGKKRHRSSGSGGAGGGGGGNNNNAFPQRMRHAAEEYKCPLCPYKCTVEKALKKHQKLHLMGAKQFVVKISCMVCGKDRSTEADLRKHMKKHREGRDFQCDVCGFASVQLKKIIQHRRMHTGEKPHLCPHCTYRSSRRDNLRSHVRRMHKKENMYIDTFNPRAEQQGGGGGGGGPGGPGGQLVDTPE